MTLKEDVLNIFKYSHTGKENPIKIRDLCIVVNDGELDPKEWMFPDRDIRKAYEDEAVCGGKTGLYLLKTEKERQDQIKLRWSLIYAHFRKIDVLENYHIESDAIQKELF